MREIKFRCWDGIGNHGMQYFDSLQEIADYYRGHKYQVEMLYTGLKDKHGQEIYEGDIIKSEYHPDEPLRVVDELMWNTVDRLRLRFHSDGSNSSHIIVLGNIYENPEVLNGRK